MKLILSATVTIFVVALLPASFSEIARAVSPTVNANVYDGKPAEIAISQDVHDLVIDQTPLVISGTIHNISQILVYINGVYSQTIPINFGDTTFSFSVAIPEGRHEIKLTGIDAFLGVTIDVVTFVSYDPIVSPTKSNNSVYSADRAVSGVKNAVVDSSDYLNSQINQASSTPGFFASVGEFGYAFLHSVDIVPGSSDKGLARNLWRFMLITIGVLSLSFSKQIITIYHWIRYRVLNWRDSSFPLPIRRHSILAVRLIASIMIIAGFLI